MKVKNILWLIPDGVRTVKYNDPFGRFEFFKTLKNEGFCEFKNMYTAHPSTYMSFSSFLRGTYATKISKTYGSLKSLRYELETVDKKLSKLGMNIYFLTFYPDDLKDQINSKIIDLVENKEKALSAYYQYKNGTIFDEEYVEEYNNYIKYFLENEQLKEPFFLLIHVNVPLFKDPVKYFNYDYNKYFEEIYTSAISKIDENSTAIIVNSDHGYPFYREGKEYNFSHDELMSQENIKASFFIKHPDIKVKEVEHNTSLVDILPTIYDIFSLEYPKYLDGISLFKTIEEGSFNRVLRVENKFPLQKKAKVVLIKDDYKIEYDRDRKDFKLFKIQKNSIKETFVTDKIMLTKYISLFNKYEKRFEEEREMILKESRRNKEKKIKLLMKKRRSLIIKSSDNPYIEEFIENYTNSKNIIIDLKNINEYINKEFEQIIFLVSEVLQIDSSILGEELHLLSLFNNTPLYVIDSYHNIEYCNEMIDEFLEKKHKIFTLRSKKKNRSEAERNKIREAFQIIYKKKVEE